MIISPARVQPSREPPRSLAALDGPPPGILPLPSWNQHPQGSDFWRLGLLTRVLLSDSIHGIEYLQSNLKADWQGEE